MNKVSGSEDTKRSGAKESGSYGMTVTSSSILVFIPVGGEEVLIAIHTLDIISPCRCSMFYPIIDPANFQFGTFMRKL